MIHEFTAIGRSQPFVHLAKEPLVVVHHSFHGFNHQSFGGPPLLCREATELGLQIWCERNFHHF